MRTVPSQKMLVDLICNVEFKAIGAQSGIAHGLSPVLAILDELGQVRGPHDAFVEAIKTALRNMAAKLDNIEQALRKK